MRWCTYKGLLQTKWTIHHVWSSTCTGWSLVHIPFSFAGELCLNKDLIRSLLCSKHSLISTWNFNGSNFFTNWTQTIFRVTPPVHSCAVACTPATENYSSPSNLIMIYCTSMPGYVPRAPPSPILPSSIRLFLRHPVESLLVCKSFLPPDQWVSIGCCVSSTYNRVMHTVGGQCLFFPNMALSGLSSSSSLWLTAWSKCYERPFLTLLPLRKYSWRWNWLNTPRGLLETGMNWAEGQNEASGLFPVLISYVFKVCFILFEVLWIL